jgi:hypothetical protein
MFVSYLVVLENMYRQRDAELVCLFQTVLPNNADYIFSSVITVFSMLLVPQLARSLQPPVRALLEALVSPGLSA